MSPLLQELELQSTLHSLRVSSNLWLKMKFWKELLVLLALLGQVFADVITPPADGTAKTSEACGLFKKLSASKAARCNLMRVGLKVGCKCLHSVNKCSPDQVEAFQTTLEPLCGKLDEFFAECMKQPDCNGMGAVQCSSLCVGPEMPCYPKNWFPIVHANKTLEILPGVFIDIPDIYMPTKEPDLSRPVDNGIVTTRVRIDVPTARVRTVNMDTDMATARLRIYGYDDARAHFVNMGTEGVPIPDMNNTRVRIFDMVTNMPPNDLIITAEVHESLNRLRRRRQATDREQEKRSIEVLASKLPVRRESADNRSETDSNIKELTILRPDGKISPSIVRSEKWRNVFGSQKLLSRIGERGILQLT